ncbi:hypothetical protein CMI47_11545 [Candidatus Pacearchaeota archaeon]|nr:hypothetical protein [Candidatus Pacearchaeota archaeon]|tara:strand:+ start:40317 stop:45689 length:5373 start_codon:yes stop_codon:yes gene_type:complete
MSNEKNKNKPSITYGADGFSYGDRKNDSINLNINSEDSIRIMNMSKDALSIVESKSQNSNNEGRRSQTEELYLDYFNGSIRVNGRSTSTLVLKKGFIYKIYIPEKYSPIFLSKDTSFNSNLDEYYSYGHSVIASSKIVVINTAEVEGSILFFRLNNIPTFLKIKLINLQNKSSEFLLDSLAPSGIYNMTVSKSNLWRFSTKKDIHIDVGDKTSVSSYYKKGSDRSYYIFGVSQNDNSYYTFGLSQPDLYLINGMQYSISSLSEEHPMIFTSSVSGGNNNSYNFSGNFNVSVKDFSSINNKDSMFASSLNGVSYVLAPRFVNSIQSSKNIVIKVKVFFDSPESILLKWDSESTLFHGVQTDHIKRGAMRIESTYIEGLSDREKRKNIYCQDVEIVFNKKDLTENFDVRIMSDDAVILNDRIRIMVGDDQRTVDVNVKNKLGKDLFEMNGQVKPDLKIVKNRKYIFKQQDISNSSSGYTKVSHPLYFTSSSSKTPDSSISVSGMSKSGVIGVDRVVELDVKSDYSSFYYSCENHGLRMGGKVYVYDDIIVHRDPYWTDDLIKKFNIDISSFCSSEAVTLIPQEGSSSVYYQSVYDKYMGGKIFFTNSPIGYDISQMPSQEGFRYDEFSKRLLSTERSSSIESRILTTCSADINNDGVVDVSDLLEIIDQWGQFGGSADINNDGIVDVTDLLEIIDQWGPCDQIDSWLEQKISPDDGEQGDKFGTSLALGNDILIVGSPGAVVDGWENMGAVYIYKYETDIGWVQTQKILGEVVTTNYLRFGGSVDLQEADNSLVLNEDRLIIGAINDASCGSDSGAAYIYKKNPDEQWIKEQKLVAWDCGNGSWPHLFSSSVAIFDSYAFVGAVGDNSQGIATGAVYVFKWDGNSWSQHQKLIAADGTDFDWFGSSLSASKDELIVGALFDDRHPSGLPLIAKGGAYVFKVDEDGYWQQHFPQLEAADGEENDGFGSSVAIHENLMIVSASSTHNDNETRGAVYIFKEQENGSWDQLYKLILGDEGVNDGYFGSSIDVLGESLLVGVSASYSEDIGPGSLYLFERVSNTEWVQVNRFVASDGINSDWFGKPSSLGIKSDGNIRCAVGARYTNSYVGSVYVYERSSDDPPYRNDFDSWKTAWTVAKLKDSVIADIILQEMHKRFTFDDTDLDSPITSFASISASPADFLALKPTGVIDFTFTEPGRHVVYDNGKLSAGYYFEVNVSNKENIQKFKYNNEIYGQSFNYKYPFDLSFNNSKINTPVDDVEFGIMHGGNSVTKDYNFIQGSIQSFGSNFSSYYSILSSSTPQITDSGLGSSVIFSNKYANQPIDNDNLINKLLVNDELIINWNSWNTSSNYLNEEEIDGEFSYQTTDYINHLAKIRGSSPSISDIKSIYDNDSVRVISRLKSYAKKIENINKVSFGGIINMSFGIKPNNIDITNDALNNKTLFDFSDSIIVNIQDNNYEDISDATFVDFINDIDSSFDAIESATGRSVDLVILDMGGIIKNGRYSPSDISSFMIKIKKYGIGRFVFNNNSEDILYEEFFRFINDIRTAFIQTYVSARLGGRSGLTLSVNGESTFIENQDYRSISVIDLPNGINSSNWWISENSVNVLGSKISSIVSSGVERVFLRHQYSEKYSEFDQISPMEESKSTELLSMIYDLSSSNSSLEMGIFVQISDLLLYYDEMGGWNINELRNQMAESLSIYSNNGFSAIAIDMSNSVYDAEFIEEAFELFRNNILEHSMRAYLYGFYINKSYMLGDALLKYPIIAEESMISKYYKNLDLNIKNVEWHILGSNISIGG